MIAVSTQSRKAAEKSFCEKKFFAPLRLCVVVVF